MSEIKRYDQALSDQLEHLPMPSEDFAWAEMKKLLDEDDDVPVMVPLFKRLGCWLPALIAALLLSIGGWFLYNSRQGKLPDSSTIAENKKDTGIGISSGKLPADLQGKINDSIAGNKTVTAGSSGNSSGKTGSSITYSADQGKKLPTVPAAPVSDDNLIGKPGGNGKKTVEKNYTDGKAKAGITKGASKAKTKARITPAVATGENENEEEYALHPPKKIMADEKGKQSVQIKNASIDSTEEKLAKLKMDSTGPVKNDSLKKPIAKPGKNEDKLVEKNTEEEKKKKDWMLAAGLSIYQPINIAGQSSVPFNYYGRKNGITDYIPSVYLRLYRAKKWFIHSEFRYAAPQAVKEVQYKAIMDTVNQNIETSVYSLKKTYYHQVPFSFNYYVLPNLSLGAGVIYNRFTGAVAGLDKYWGIPGTVVDSLLSSEIINEKSDERFVKNKLQWSAELQYNWKRFLLGFRYSRDIQPYLKYTDTFTGESFEKYAQSLNIYLRYELWRSKKNK